MRASGLALLVAAAAVATAVDATPIVQVFARSGADSISLRSQDDVSLNGARQLGGRATAGVIADGTIVTGPIPQCANPPGLGCAIVPTDYGRGSARAGADGDRGTLRAAATASENADASGRALAALLDTITLTEPTIGITLDIDALGGAILSPDEDWSGSITFRIFLQGTEPETDPDVDLLRLVAFRDTETSSFSVARLVDNGVALVFDGEEQAGIPSRFTFDYDLSELRFLGGRPLPSIFPIGVSPVGMPLDLGFELIATANCVSSEGCHVDAFADHTLYVALQGTSSNGYRYLGPSVDPPPPVGEVDEPGALALAIAAALAALMRRRFRRA